MIVADWRSLHYDETVPGTILYRNAEASRIDEEMG
jgi:hypothetical protein